MRNRLLRTTAAAVIAAAAAAVPARAEPQVGVTSAVNQSAELERASRKQTVVIGENVLFKDRVITSREALVQILFVDGSAFTIGSNARVVIDEFVFNPSSGSGDLVAEVTEGALRFVGGKLSKNGGQVRFKTPVGTLGVRGAIVNIDLAPPCSDGVCPIATASLVFGREILATLPNGRTERVYRPGYSLVFTGDPNNPTVRVVPTASLDQSGLQARLSGRPGQNGGARVIPTDANVVASGLPQINSDRSPRFVLPRPRPTTVPNRYAPERDAVGVTTVTNEINNTIVEQATGDVINNQIAQQEYEPPIDPVTRAATTVLVTPETFTTSDGTVIEQPQNVDIATRDRSYNVSAVQNSSGQIIALEIGDMTFPYPPAEGEYPVPPTYSPILGTTVEGTILRLPGQAGVVFLQEEGTSPRSGYIVVGTPTPRSVFYPDTARTPVVRTYDLGTDYEKDSKRISSAMPLLNPLVAQAFGNGFLNGAAATGFYMVDREDGSFINTLYASLAITKRGANQNSAIVTSAGGVYRATVGGVNDALGVGGERRGSYRLGATSASVGTMGAIGSVEVGNSALNTSIIGPNGEVFVLSSGEDAGFARNSYQPLFRDVRLGTPVGAASGPDDYSSMVVPAVLAGSADLSSHTRQLMSLSGFAAGMVESGDGTVAPFRAVNTGDFNIAFDRQNATLGGTILVSDIENQSSAAFFRYAFGYDTTGEFPSATTARGTYLDDDTFVAGATGYGNYPGSPTTLLVTDDDVVVDHGARDAGTYLVSSEAVPQPKFFANSGVTPCDCEFLKWGWWGSQTEFESADLPNGGRRDFVHLGTWVAGDVTNEIDLPTTGTARYNGHAVGSVFNNGAQYVAAGQLAVTYDFGERAGNVAISKFDGRSFSGSIAAVPGLARGNQFAGPLSGSGLSGSTTGAFVRGPEGPAQGVIGGFDVSGANYRATGSYMGQQ